MNNDQAVTSFDTINKEAAHYIAGGVVSLNRKVSPPIVFKKAKGCKLFDINNKEYIDYHAAFAPYILGHNNDQVNDAVLYTIKENHSLYGTGTNLLEIQLAKELCSIIPSFDLVQLTNSGSEATAHAIRLSRAYTGREDIVLMMGGYNGWHNDVARAVMPSLDVIGKRIALGEYPFIPSSAGIPGSVKSKIHCINFNDIGSLEYVLKKYPVACVLTEPVLQNIGVVLPHKGYLQAMLTLCEQYGAVCVFDEVKTGFRTSLSGYQGTCGVVPHLSVFGKAIANGYPVGVIGGKKEIMSLFDDPDTSRRVLIAGTYNAHPLNTAAALATIGILKTQSVYEHLDSVSKILYAGWKQIFAEKGMPATVTHNGSASAVYFCENPPADLHDILENHDFNLDLKYRRLLIENGIYQIPLPCKQNSISFAHTFDDIMKTLEVTRKVVKQL
ncbi:MAG: glutamate-1-semialdehyde 2,1-aminomutase [Bacteroidota bacterium]|nr:MAG: glutamate-1-semialdehyde 2,1-aminomutase [Bacteroidota bacterium]